MFKKSGANILTYIFILAILIIFVFLMIKAPVLHDDIYFREEGGGSISSAIKDSLDYGNGRFGGNFCIYYLMQHDVLRIVIKSVVAILMFLIASFLVDEKKSLFAVSLFLFLTVEVSIFRQVYASSAAYFNYVIPIFMLFATIFLIEKSNSGKLSCLIVFVFGFSMQLFAEHNTVINCLIALAIVLFKVWFEKGTEKKKEISFLISSVLGAGVMLLMPEFLGVSDKMDFYRYMPTSVGDIISVCMGNAYTIATVFLKNTVIIIFISILCIVLSKKNKKISVLQIAVFTLTAVVGLLLKFTDVFGNFKGYRATAFFVLICFAFCVCFIVTVLRRVSDVRTRNRMIGDIVFSLMSFMVILPVFPIGTRCLFLGYSILTIGALRLFRYTLSDKEIEKASLFLSVVITVVLVFVAYMYSCGRKADDERMKYLSEKLSAGETEITMPILPYSQMFANCGHSYVFDQYYYIEEPGDVKYEFVPYDEWLEIKK